MVTVVGNKNDLENARVVSTEEGQSFAGEHGCLFIETSAKDDVNVNVVSITKLYVFCFLLLCTHGLNLQAHCLLTNIT